MNHRLKEINQKEPVPGFKGRFVHADNFTIAYWTVEQGAELPEHSHLHEQYTQVLEGQFKLTVGEETKVYKPGIAVTIPSMVPHQGIALTNCRIMDVYSPVREDLKD